MVDCNANSRSGAGAPTPLWVPAASRAAATKMERFRRFAERATGMALTDYDALHAFSVTEPERFWGLLADFLRLPFDLRGAAVRSPQPMPYTRWFEGSTLNYSRALLYPNDLADPEAVAIIGVTEAGSERRLTWRQLRTLVARIQRRLTAAGVGEGDAVAAFAANVPETAALFIACAGLGAVFSSCSPDFGWQAAAARFTQLAPRLLFATTGYSYGGRWFDTSRTVANLSEQLPTLAAVVRLPHPQAGDHGGGTEVLDGAVDWGDWLEDGFAPREGHAAAVAGAQTDRPDEPVLRQLPFDHPLYVLYSSGTTGTPKAMVHRAGGALLTHMKEHALHADLRAGDVVYYFSTCGWMMWNWLVSALAQAATIVLYDGSPAWPHATAQFELAERLGISFFGTSARFIAELRAVAAEPGATHDLVRLRTVASTGSPLSAEGFSYVYESVKADVHLASISGGTDIVSCFMLGVPTLPVYAGQIQRPGLGVDLRVLNEDGEDVVGVPGELVCAQPLPSMPLGFIGDEEFSRYQEAYLLDYPGMWRHGDLVERTPEGGIVVYGRSDATLNPGGVRIGTAEIYRPLEAVPEVLEAVAVGKRDGADQQIWLLVVLRAGQQLDDDLTSRIVRTVREGASPRHAPRRVIQVPELPRTRSGKSMELAVARLVNGESVPNMEVMANPDCVPLLLAALEG